MRNTLNTAVLTLSILNFNIDINDDYIFMRHTWDPYPNSEYRKRVPDREKPNLQQWISPSVCIDLESTDDDHEKRWSKWQDS